MDIPCFFCSFVGLQLFFSILFLFLLFTFRVFQKEDTLMQWINKFNPGLTKQRLKSFEQLEFKPGLVNPEIKPDLC